MGWYITNVSNTIKVTPECAAELAEKADWVFDDPEYVCDEDGLITFCEDHMEHMDYLHEPIIQKVLMKHKVTGEATFASSQGDNKGQSWGHRFVDGKYTLLTGKTTHTFEPA